MPLRGGGTELRTTGGNGRLERVLGNGWPNGAVGVCADDGKVLALIGSEDTPPTTGGDCV